MLMSSFFRLGCARIKHRSAATANVSWFGAAWASPRTFSSGTLPRVPARTPLFSPTPGGGGGGGGGCSDREKASTRGVGGWSGCQVACLLFDRVFATRLIEGDIEACKPTK